MVYEEGKGGWALDIMEITFTRAPQDDRYMTYKSVGKVLGSSPLKTVWYYNNITSEGLEG